MTTPLRRFHPSAFAILAASLAASAAPAGDAGFGHATLRVTTASGSAIEFQVEVADTSALRQRGLMGRTALPADRGMLLSYPQPQPVSIWMKDTPLPLDILFIASGRVASIVANATPMSEAAMPSPGPVGAVLEINAGRARALDIAAGDRVEIGRIDPHE